MNDPVAEREAIHKAYTLRDSANEATRLAIIALYHSAATQDLYEAERNYRNWTELYPRSASAWNGLSIVERDLGHHADALAAVKHALELRPNIMAPYANLAYEQLETGDIPAARATCENAIAKGLDADHIRGYLFESAYAMHDASVVQQQRDWAAAHPDAIYVRLDEVEIAITEGRFADAHRLLPQLAAILRHRGLAAPADDLVRGEGFNMIGAGDVEEGTRFVRSVPVDPRSQLSVLALAGAGDLETASASLHAMQAEFPQGTILNDYLQPEVQAIGAIRTHKPADAVIALERIRPLEGRDPFIPKLRADAYLADGQAGLAEVTYRRVVEGPVQNPITEEVPLSWLGLGRSLAAQGNITAAIDAYQHFFTLWAHADANANYLHQARREFADLHTALLHK